MLDNVGFFDIETYVAQVLVFCLQKWQNIGHNWS